ncbi:trihelix transcription factor ASIL2-like [Selaginella moellendorffii]|uniref:trihelix transcription factor ASIL2-like n=1 Tax=Selaginella moellendorffii TaxID=88036 RepID=UPI000D1CDB60|nr:trihelix transcription factor ASIL2-like [Selaginella moellendorffii]|eukprot:XP_024542265.1 trihelix transcription factor ASIL2-like [Selaginella moellendorffii]
MALHPFAEANPQQPTPIAACLPQLMKEDLQHAHHHHHHHLHELERMSKIPINGKSAWTDAATDVLIDVFEEKWNSLRRGNLKAKNWDEVGAELGNRCGVPKTGDQCRHKIEKLRGKFRQEKVVAVLGQSKWPWYDRLNMMFGGGGGAAAGGGGNNANDKAPADAKSSQEHSAFHRHQHNSHIVDEDGATATTTAPAVGFGVVVSNHQHQHHQQQQQHQHHGLELIEARSVHGMGDDERNDTSYTSQSGKSTDRDETASPRSKSGGGGSRKRGRESSSSDLGAALKYLSETLIKIEECKVELQRDNERVRMEMEARRAQMHEVELKRTEMLIQMELKRTEMLCELELRRTKMQMDLFENLAGRASSRPKRST